MKALLSSESKAPSGVVWPTRWGAFNVKQTHAALIAHCSKRESARLDGAQPSPTHYR